MPSASATEKKLHEQEVLRTALIAARKRGGECRRLSDRLNGTVMDRSFDESPDIVVRHEGHAGASVLIGIEHFRVDQLNEWNAKAEKTMSATMRVKRRLDSLRGAVVRNNSSELSDEQYKELGSIVDELWAAEGMESLDGFMQAFSEVFIGHLHKSSTYRESIAGIANEGESQELAFLIETHVDYSRFRLWDGYKMSVPPDGELPMLKELVELFGEAVGRVDYLILAMCPQFGSEVIDARIVNCSSLGSSLSRQKARVVEYLGYSHSLVGFVLRDTESRESHVEVVRNEDVVGFRRSVAEGESLGRFESFQHDLDGFAQAIELRGKHKPFLATFGVSMFLELFGDYALRDWAPRVRFELPDLIRWKNQMGPDEWYRRDACFRKAHNIKDELLSDQLSP